MTTGASGAIPGAATPAASTADAFSWRRVVLWTLLFQAAWHWRRIPELFSELALPDNDDFLRLQQVRDFLGGQGWYDLIQHRMGVAPGADIHWSRLVDVPIAALIAFFDLFTDTATAEVLALIVWPTLLLVATVVTVVALCRSVSDRFNPLLAVLLTVTCFTALTEFMPGRIDHHGIQILLFCLTLLGLANGAARWGHLLAGAAMAASISIGLDSILLIVLVLAWLGLEWVVGRDSSGRGLALTAAGLGATALLLYPLNFPPSRWLEARCDANSVVYLAALVTISAGFLVLAGSSPRLTGTTWARTAAMRLAAGTAAGLGVVAVLYGLFPQCATGPYGTIEPELDARWLVNVNEAMGLLPKLAKYPDLWFSGVGYGLVLLAMGAAATWRWHRDRPAVVPIFAALLITLGAMFLQYRALRIGVYASIPLCILFAGMSWQWLSRHFSAPLAGALQALIVAAMLSPIWILAGQALFPDVNSAPVAADTNAGEPVAAWKTESRYLFCNEKSQYAVLAGLPAGHVMSDINSGPEILVFTPHTVAGGGYHRNGKAILSMLDFFETDMEKPRAIAGAGAFQYVAWCDSGELTDAKYDSSPALAVALARGKPPAWLEPLSPAHDRLQVYRVRN